MNKIFEKSVRIKLRFNVPGGVLSTEDLWDISLKSLDTLYQGLVKQLKEKEEDSLLIKVTPRNTKIKLSIAIIKHIVETRLEEVDKRNTALERKEKKDKLLSLLAEKQDESLKGKSEEEIKAMIEAL